MAKSIAVLGLGKFGMSLVRSLNEMGADVLAVDKVEDYVQEIANFCSEAICADLANEEDLNKLGLKEMDIVVCAMGESLEASILSVAVAKEQGVPLIVAKSSSARMSSILRKVGVNRVIMPEEYAGARSAAMLVSESVLDYFELGSRLSMIEMVPLNEWIGKSMAELNIRNKYQMTIVAGKDEKGEWMPMDPEQPLQEKMKLLAVVDRKNLGMLKNQ
jgi:trk system potassium uptake protein TrkA